MLTDQYSSIIGAQLNSVTPSEPLIESDILWSDQNTTEESARFEVEFGVHVYTGKCAWIENHARLISCTRGMPDNARERVLEAFQYVDLDEEVEA